MSGGRTGLTADGPAENMQSVLRWRRRWIILLLQQSPLHGVNRTAAVHPVYRRRGSSAVDSHRFRDHGKHMLCRILHVGKQDVDAHSGVGVRVEPDDHRWRHVLWERNNDGRV